MSTSLPVPSSSGAPYDAIVVGARCAGAPTAMLLARKGYRVLLVDRATFPSDTPRGHYVQPPGVARLKRWGLLERVLATGCPPVGRVTFDVGPFALAGSPPAADGVRFGIAPRRSILDNLLVEAAVDAGVTLWERFSVEDIVLDGGRAVGIRGRQAGGAPRTARARLVVGADGCHSVVARAVGAPTYHARPILSVAYWGYWAGVPLDGAEGYLRDRAALFAAPTNDDLALVAVQWPIADLKEIRRDVEGAFFASLAQAPAFEARVRAGRRVERMLFRTDLHNFFRKPYGPGWALVGDAGYHKDPYTAQGIGDAFRDADSLATAIDAGFAGRRPLDEALAGHERDRNAHAMPMYDLTCQLAAIEPPPPEMQQLLGALRGNQADTDRFLGCIAGTTPIPAFFAPENLQRIVGAAAG